MTLVAFLTGCGEGESGAPGADEIPSATALARQAGCIDFRLEPSSAKESLAQEHGTCRLQDEVVSIHTYADNETRDRAESIAAATGGVSVLGDRFVVRVKDPKTAAKVRDAVGGEIARPRQS